jgi:hypothetical protein
MPHNRASAECVRYLRHMLALEDGQSLRLLGGITAVELSGSGACVLRHSPTRFGRINLAFEPAGPRGWRLQFERADGPAPASIAIPITIDGRSFAKISGARYKNETGKIEVDPQAPQWEAFWS